MQTALPQVSLICLILRNARLYWPSADLSSCSRFVCLATAPCKSEYAIGAGIKRWRIMFFFFTSSHLKLVLEVWSNRVGAALGALTVVGPGVEALASNRDENKPLGIE